MKKRQPQVVKETIVRQWQLLRLLPRYPRKITVSELRSRLAASGFDTTKRTIERDLNLLASMFPVAVDDRERPYGWSWEKNAPVLDVPGLTTVQALTFALLQRFLAGLLPQSLMTDLEPYFRAAQQHLAALPKGRGVPSWTEKVRVAHPTQSLLPPKVSRQALGGVYEGLLHNRQIRIIYQKRDATGPMEYLVHPLGIVQRGPVTYLVCTLFHYQDVLLLALHRVLSTVVLDVPANYPKGFDLDAYIEAGKLNFGEGAKIRLEALFTSDAAKHLEETALSADQKIHPVDDERVKVVATVPDTPQVRWWLLAFGGQVEVLKPVRMRREMASAAAALYSSYHAKAS